MTYSPGSPGYQPAQSGGSYASGTPSFAKDDDGKSKLPFYLTIAVAVLGFLAYLASFGPILTVNADNANGISGEGTTVGLSLAMITALLAGLLAAVSLVPKDRSYVAVTAAVAVLALLLVVYGVVNTGNGVSIGWGLWLVLVASVLQAFAAVAALLLDAGVITPPAPRPKYDPYAQYGQYGQYGGQYGQQQYYGQQQHAGSQHNPQQPAGYGQYGGYPSSQAPTQSAPTTGGFGAQPQSGPQPAAHQQGTNTPPTGFPSFSPPPSSGAGSEAGSGPGNYGGQSEPQQSYGQGQPQSPSSPSGPAPA